MNHFTYDGDPHPCSCIYSTIVHLSQVMAEEYNYPDNLLLAELQSFRLTRRDQKKSNAIISNVPVLVARSFIFITLRDPIINDFHPAGMI